MNHAETTTPITTPLAGLRVLVTRARAQAPDLSDRLRALGAEPVELPAIEIGPPDDRAALDAAVASAPEYDWLVFTSVNGVDAFLARAAATGLDTDDLAGARIVAIGGATAARLREHGLPVDFVPPRFVAEEVLDGMVRRGASGRRVLLPRAAEARDVLPNGLRAAGASVDVVAAYRTVPGRPPADAMARLETGEIDIATFTSSSTVRNLLALIDGRVALLDNAIVACIGPITAETARQAGLAVHVVAGEYSIPGLVAALVEAVERRQQ